MLQLRRTDPVNVDVRLFSADVPKQIEIPLERQSRMVPALHQDLNSARRGKFVEFLVEFFAAQNVMVRVFFGPIKSAELAVNVADIRVINVAIDYVSHDLAPAAVVTFFLRQIAPRSRELSQIRER